MNNLSIKVDTYPVQGKDNLKGYATMTINEAFVVKNMKLFQNKNGGLFVSMPSIKDKNGTYHDICYPISKELRTLMNQLAVESYKEQVKQQDHAQETEKSVQFEQSM